MTTLTRSNPRDTSATAVDAPPPAFRVAAVQMASGPNVNGNLREATRLIEMAVDQGARLVGLPEYFPIMGMKDTDKVALRESDGRGPMQDFLASAARRLGI